MFLPLFTCALTFFLVLIAGMIFKFYISAQKFKKIPLFIFCLLKNQTWTVFKVTSSRTLISHLAAHFGDNDNLFKYVKIYPKEHSIIICNNECHSPIDSTFLTVYLNQKCYCFSNKKTAEF